MSHPV